MADLYVIPVEQIVDRQFPVAADAVFLDAVHDRHVAMRRHHAEPEAANIAEVFLERRRGGVHRGKDNPL
jgi:hypothetical protein